MRRGLALVLASPLLAGIALGCGGQHVDRGAYVQANRAIFRELPRFPGSSLRSETSSPRAGGEDKPAVGYVTRFDLLLPADARRAAVSAFYEQRLHRRWRLVEKLSGPVLNFRRREALVSVNLENLSSRSLEIAVDHAFYA